MAASPPLTPQSNQLPTFSDAQGVVPVAREQCVATALARFEYEVGHTSVASATKVLLIEWEAGSRAKGRKGQWTVEWKGGRKQTLLAEESGRTPADADADYGEIRDQPSDHIPTLRTRSESLPSSDKPTHRLYFILPAGVAVPPTVAISFIPNAHDAAVPDEELKVTIPTLPAIFPPSLLTTGTAQGKKGVLHTLWAKSRLHALRAEMVQEETRSTASEEFRTAQTEFEWICENFGIGEQYGTKHGLQTADSALEEAPASLVSPASLSTSSTSPYPTTPVSPGGSERFLSKMRGLRVGTGSSGVLSAAQLQQPTPPQTDSSNLAGRNPLSPEAGDVAVGSFAALKGSRGLADASAPPAEAKARTAVPIAPPPTLKAQQAGGFDGMASLGGLSTGRRAPATSENDEDEHDEELFALPISPRSPDMAKSPFSWDKQDVNRAAAAAAAAAVSR